MREIKFRGKLLNSGKWAYGNLDIKKTGTAIITPDKTALGTYGRVEPETIGQYTGLHDKKGQEIYEGDIVRFPANDEYDEVNYISYECWFDSRDTFKYGWHFSRSKFHGCLCGGNSCVSMEWARQLEVIGNVHDNKELLEE